MARLIVHILMPLGAAIRVSTHTDLIGVAKRPSGRLTRRGTVHCYPQRILRGISQPSEQFVFSDLMPSDSHMTPLSQVSRTILNMAYDSSLFFGFHVLFKLHSFNLGFVLTLTEFGTRDQPLAI